MSDQRITYFAHVDARNKQTPFGIKNADRTRHVYVIGKTGMGKSTLLENMAVQDIRNGEGFAFVDPHGKSADLLLDYIPPERVNDVLYFAPFDMENPIALNVMEDVGYDKRHLVVNGLMAAFKKIWIDAWSARMEYILQNTLLALLEYPDATMLDVNRMYTDKPFRTKVVDNIQDPLVKSFWVDEYATYTDRYTQEATPAIQNKVGQFTGNPLIRNIVGQPKSSFDIREMMDKRKIMIVNLSKGQVGEGNANLLGSMLITKIYLAALSRADVPEATLRTLPNFYLYVDEFQSFANESFADILSEARKYKLNLTIAHQYIEQMSEEVRAAVFGNVGTMISFRVGAFDAEVLEKEFAPQFTATDLVNLGFAQVYLKLMIDGVSSQPFSAKTMAPIAPPSESFRDAVIQKSREHFARPREGVETRIRNEYEAQQRARAEAAEAQSRKARGDNERRGIEPRREGREIERRPQEASAFARARNDFTPPPPRFDTRTSAPRSSRAAPPSPSTVSDPPHPPEPPGDNDRERRERYVPLRAAREELRQPFGEAFLTAMREKDTPRESRTAGSPNDVVARGPVSTSRGPADARAAPAFPRETASGLRDALRALAESENARKDQHETVRETRTAPEPSPSPLAENRDEKTEGKTDKKSPIPEVSEDALRKIFDADS